MIIPNSMAVHDEAFHADDVFAVAMMQLINPNITVTRTRDPAVLSTADIRVDVGDHYNGETDFDHHKVDSKRYPPILFNRQQMNGPRLSGFGMLYEKFGNELIHRVVMDKFNTVVEHINDKSLYSPAKRIFDNVQRQLVIPIDIEDNGEHQIYYPLGHSPFRASTISQMIGMFLPTSIELEVYKDDDLMEQRFQQAVEIAKTILVRVVTIAYSTSMDVLFIKETLEKAKMATPDSEYLILPRSGAWAHTFDLMRRNRDQLYYDFVRNIKIVIFPMTLAGTSWRVQSTKMFDQDSQSVVLKNPLPEELRGKSGKEIQEKVSLSSSEGVFVHPAGFIGGTSSREDALKLMEYSLIPNK